MTAAVRLALYRPHRWGDIGGRLICWWTRSPYSHCELVVGGECYSSSIRDGGVRRKWIDLHARHWDVIDVPWADPAGVVALYADTHGDPYGWLDLIGSQVVNRRLQDRDGWFCSEWCATALQLPTPELYSPGALADFVRDYRK